MQNFLVTNKKEPKNKTQTFYDSIIDVHSLVMKINGYRTSVSKYFRSLDLEIDAKSSVLDAGCGTGVASVAFYEAGYRPKETIALDLSFKSLEVAKEQFEDSKIRAVRDVRIIQGNILSMPFVDEKFDVVLTCGALEYVPLESGLDEFARILKKGGVMVLIPIRPSILGSVLEILYNFKSHSISEVKKAAAKNFKIIAKHKFAITEPIGWSKSVLVLQKK